MSDGARGQSGHGCWFLLGLWFLVVAPASNLQLCSLDSSPGHPAPPWSYHQDLAGGKRRETELESDSERQTESETDRVRDTDTQR